MKNFYLKFIQWVLASQARIVIRNHKPFVIAITGSVGKSSTREAVYQVLSDHFGTDQVRRNLGNLNTEIGVPLTILGYAKQPSNLIWPIFLIGSYFRTFTKKYPKYLILEMGVDHPGDIAYLCSIAQPDLAIITSTEGAHLANFKSLEQYRDEKISIVKELKADGKLILNIDDQKLRDLPYDKVYRYSLADKDADFYAESVKFSLSGTDYRVSSTGQKIAIKSQLLGYQFIYSSLAAFAVGHVFGLQSMEIKKSLDSIKPLNGRMRVISGKNDVWIIDDTYNANPSSVRAALQVLADFEHSGRKVAIIGNMNELGKSEKSDHISIGEFSSGKADLVIFVGPNAENMAKTSNDGDKILWFPNRIALEKKLNSVIKSGDLVLIKASQNRNFFEEITKKLMSEPEKADQLLVRQGKEWAKKKNII